jgi:hypothetical protein
VKKKYKILLVILLVVIVAAIALRVYYVTHREWDIGPPDDSDLVFEWPDVPDEENAYYYLKQLKGRIHDASLAEIELISKMMIGEEPWDPAVLEPILEKNKGAFQIMDRMLACRMYVPVEPGLFSYEALFNPVRELSRQRYYWCAYLATRGENKAAFDQAMSIVKLGHIIESSPGSITDYMSGLAIKGMGLGALREGIANVNLPSDMLMEYVRELTNYEANTEGMALSIRHEYTYACRIIDEMLAGTFSLSDFDSAYGFYPDNLKPGRLFQPNRTKRMLAETFRELISDLQKNAVEMGLPDPLPGLVGMFGEVPIKDRIPVGVNQVGRIVYDWHTAIVYHMLPLKCRENSEVRMTRVLLALKSYQLEHGELPESLEQLVPQYIDAVPPDDFTGKPLRYSKEEKLIWSVGRDMRDSGGKREWDSKNEELVHDDIGYEITF